MTYSDLYKRSVEVIRENQTPSGAYLASPNFPTYHYCWFRDGAFIAYAMDLTGEHDSASRFHEWAASAINQRANTVGRAVAAGVLGEIPAPADQLHTRYTASGEPGDEDWPNFQLDGLGTWLWALREHQKHITTPLSSSAMAATSLTAEYLVALWPLPCYDCWEEFPDKIHPHTLAAIYCGLLAAEELTGVSYDTSRQKIREAILTQGVGRNHFVKFFGTEVVDASLLGLAIPYGVVPADHPIFRNTVDEIERTLRSGGVHRYAADTYFGGGQWVLLAAWLGWVRAICGERAAALELLAWVEAQATKEGYLPEQVPVALNDPDYYEPWRARWGDIASPLLWSHAMYIILREALT